MGQDVEDDGTYESALAALFSPLHQSATPDALRRAAARRTVTPSDLRHYLERINLPHSSPLHRRAVLHVAGTKGKGSTASLAESVLRRRYGLRTGLFTSPHLVDVRERIRIDGLPVSKDAFAAAYWSVRRRLEAWNDDADATNDNGNLPVLPGYFRMLTVMALFVFAYHDPPIDAVVLEVGMGGRYDATNVFDHSNTDTVCGVTLIDYDHVRVLGNTLEEIAWEKGGIYASTKRGRGKRVANAYSDGDDVGENQEENSDNDVGDTPPRCFALGTNTPGVLDVLRKCAREEGGKYDLVVVNEDDPGVLPPKCRIGLPGNHQRANAALAVSICDALMQRMRRRDPTAGTASPGEGSDSSSSLEYALAEAFWPGRCQTFELRTDSREKSTTRGRIVLRCDGAHTPVSFQACLAWFRSVATDGKDSGGGGDGGVSRRALVFNCGHERNPVPLLDLLLQPPSSGSSSGKRNESDFSPCPPFDAVYFCRADSERPSAVKEASPSELLHQAGVEIDDDKDERNNKGGNGEGTGTWQDTLASLWTTLEHLLRKRKSGDGNDASSSLHHAATAVVANLTVADAIAVIKAEAEATGGVGRTEVLVTGSLYVVGSALRAVGWAEESAPGHLVIP